MDTDPTMHQPCRRPRKRQRTRFRVGASLPGSGRHAHRGRSLHFSVLHGQAPGWGGMPQDPCSCPKRLPALPVDPASLRAREHGGQPALGTTSSVSALLLPRPSSALLCFLRPLFAVQREFLKLNKRYPDCRLRKKKKRPFLAQKQDSSYSINLGSVDYQGILCLQPQWSQHLHSLHQSLNYSLFQPQPYTNMYIASHPIQFASHQTHPPSILSTS